jgi:YHS domain-containing protein
MKRNMLVLGLWMITTLGLSAQRSEVIKDGNAIYGYDPVAYFIESKPVKGTEQFSFNWNNANWIFSNQQNLDSFKLNPGKYAPQYGGYCAYGVSEDHKAPTDPEAWTVIDGKLYLNYNPKVKEYWNKNRKKRIEDANRNWMFLKDKE